jgi:hypothetical protein
MSLDEHLALTLRRNLFRDAMRATAARFDPNARKSKIQPLRMFGPVRRHVHDPEHGVLPCVRHIT